MAASVSAFIRSCFFRRRSCFLRRLSAPSVAPGRSSHQWQTIIHDCHHPPCNRSALLGNSHKVPSDFTYAPRIAPQGGGAEEKGIFYFLSFSRRHWSSAVTDGAGPPPARKELRVDLRRPCAASPLSACAKHRRACSVTLRLHRSRPAHRIRPKPKGKERRPQRWKQELLPWRPSSHRAVMDWAGWAPSPRSSWHSCACGRAPRPLCPC